MKICLLGQNHRTAPIELRERLAFDDHKHARLGELIARENAIEEGVVLSTCNRVEVYTVSRHDRTLETLGGLLAEVHGVALPEWEQTTYFHEDDQAVRHLFRVASGLDSLVLGEGQILAQVKSAVTFAKDKALSRDVLLRVFHDAVACGKRVRTDTKVGEGAVSVAYAAVSLARKIFKNLEEETVLVIGAGETGRQVARHLQMFGVRDIRVTNRSRERGSRLADELNATLVPYDQFPRQMGQAGIVITATSAPGRTVDEPMMRAAVREGQRRASFLIDLSVPRAIDPEVNRIAGVFLYNVDDLQGIVLDGEDRRRLEAAKAEGIVDEQLSRFLDWYHGHRLAPVMAELREKYEQIRRTELETVRTRLDPAQQEEFDRLTGRMVRKLLHAPTVGMKRLGRDHGDALVDELRTLFGLDSEKQE